MQLKSRLWLFIVVPVFVVVGLLVFTKPASAAWGNVQIEVKSTYSMKTVLVTGWNQNGEQKTWQGSAGGELRIATSGWWWKTSRPVIVHIIYTNDRSQTNQFYWPSTPFWYDWQTASFAYYGTDADNPKAPTITSPNSSSGPYDQRFTFTIAPAPANYTKKRDFNVGVEQIGGSWRWSSGWTTGTSWSIGVPADGQYRLWAQQGDTVNRGSPVVSMVITVKRAVGTPSIKSPTNNQFVKRVVTVEITPGSLNYTKVADWLVQCYANASNPDGSIVAQVGWTRSKTPQITLNGDGAVFCRVRQGDTVNKSSGWSAPITLRVASVVNAPKILSPKPNSEVSGKRFKVELESVGTMYWKQLQFRVQVARDPNFASIEKSTEWQTTTATNVTWPNPLRATVELEVSRYWERYYIRAQVRNEAGVVSAASTSTHIVVPFFYDRVKAISQDVINTASESGGAYCTELIQHAFRAGGLPGIDQGFFGGFKTWIGNGYLVKWMEAYPDMWEFRSFQDLEPGDAILYSSIGGNAQNWREVDGNGASKFGHVALVIGKNPAGKTLASHWNIGGYSGSPRPQGLEYDAYIGGAVPVLGIHIRSSGVTASSPSIAPVSAPTFVPPNR